VLIGSGHPVFPGHRGKLNRLMEICSSRRTHVESHDISSLCSLFLSRARFTSSAFLESPRKCALRVFTPLDLRATFSVFVGSLRRDLLPATRTSAFHIAEIRSSICLKRVRKNRSKRETRKSKRKLLFSTNRIKKEDKYLLILNGVCLKW
jgi:hypothetical protein